MRRLGAGLAALVLWLLMPAAAVAAPTADVPTTTPIKHLVMLMQDNHSFDNYFGTYPGADGIPEGTCQRLSLTQTTLKGCVRPFRMGELPADGLGQSVAIQKRQLNDGKMDGFVAAYRRLGRDGTSAMGYYDGQDIPYYWNVADEYVLFDRFFASTSVGSRESYLYWLAGQAPKSDKPLTNSSGYDELDTIFDRLAAKKVSAKFYVEHLNTRLATTKGSGSNERASQTVKVPLLSMKRFQAGGRLAGKVVDLSEYTRDLQNGTLPSVSYLVTTGSGENPPSRVAVGQRLVQKLTSDLMRSPYWSSSAFLWTYDGWGGWYDHVVPPSVDARGYGFRVPALMVSPYARRGLVDHTVLDYTSMLKFIESNWGVAPLASRDAAASNLVSAFDFSSAPRKAALLPATRDAEVRFTPNPRATPVIYTAYGLALVGVAVLIAGVAALQRPFAQSLLRQLSHGSAPVLQAGRVRLAAVLPWSAGQLDDALARALRRLGRALHLPPRPFAVLWRWAVLGGYQPRHSWERQLRDDAATAWAAWYRTESGADGGAGPAGEEPVDWVAWYRSMSATAIVAQHGPYGPQLPGGTGPL